MPKILVADDSITVRKVAERLLTEAGFDVVLASNGGEALAWLAHERPDLIISDVIMPDKTGYDLCTFVRSHERLSATPILLISGLVDEEVTRLAESCRANGVLKKPFQGSALQDRVAGLLAQYQGPPVFAPVPAPAPPVPPKVYRITEEQLQTFRQTAARIKELEASLAEERARSAQLVTRLVEAQRTAARTQAKLEELARVLAQVAQSGVLPQDLPSRAPSE